jgi:hypothetical protein
MSTATNNTHQRKRIRIDDNPTEINDSYTALSRLPYNLYSGVLASLQPTIRTVADFYFKTLIKALKLVNETKEKLKKFDDNQTFIPRSCRTNFTVGASDLVKGSTEYATLLATIEQNNKTSAENNRNYVKQMVQLEVEHATKHLRDLFCESLFKLSTIFLHHGHFGSEITTENIHSLSVGIIEQQPSIIKYIFDDSVNTFKIWYNKKYNVNTTQAATLPRQRRQLITALLPGGSRNIDDYHPSYGERASYLYAEDQQPGSGLDMLLANRRLRVDTMADDEDDDDDEQQNNDTILKLPAFDREMYSQLMFRMANQHWSTMLQLHHSKFVNAQLAKLAETLITADKTNDAAVIIASQPPANEVIISELIDQKLKELTGKIEKTILTKAKNNKRGEKQTRAAQQNKSKITKAPPLSTSQPPKKTPKKPPKTTPTQRREPPTKSKPATKSKTQGQKKTSSTPNRKRKVDDNAQDSISANEKSTSKKKAGKSKTPRKPSSKSNRTNGTRK